MLLNGKSPTKQVNDPVTSAAFLGGVWVGLGERNALPRSREEPMRGPPARAKVRVWRPRQRAAWP